MNTIFHIITSFGTLRRGGMEISTGEIVEHLLSLGRNKALIYSRESAPEHEPSHPEAQFVDIFTPSQLAAAPLLSRNSSETGRIQRVELQCLRNSIEGAMRDAPDARHVIVSFYISSNGFLAQQVADLLRLPHVACVRGSDFNVDTLSIAKSAAVRHVSDRCDYLVLTNYAQYAYFKKVLGRNGATTVVYNQVAKPDRHWTPGGDLEFFSDCGFSYKKATQILLRAFDIFRREWPDTKLCVVGPREGDEAYWAETLRPYDADPMVTLLPESLPAREVEERLVHASAYVSASLGEGCSRAVLGAAIRGVPIISTAVGILPEPELPFQNLFLAAPASAEDLAEAMGRFALARQSGELTADPVMQRVLEERFSPKAVRESWHDVLSDVLRKKHSVTPRRQPRILFYVHDGTGLGHLQRVARIAKGLQGTAACLILCGHRAASWIVPQECEYLHIPSLESLLPNKAGYWGRKPFLTLSKREALELRGKMIRSAMDAFEPDAIVVDYLPLGKHGELTEFIENRQARKYFILRGVLDHADNVPLDIIGGRGEAALSHCYDRIFVTSDRKIIDVSMEYSLPPIISNKIEYVGYVAEPVAEAHRLSARANRLAGGESAWAVCSAGGGALGERLMSELMAIAASRTGVAIDLVLGPRSGLDWPVNYCDHYDHGSVRIWRENRHLSVMNASADVVVTAGGYNSLVEALQGDAEILCVPSQVRTTDEQYIHTRRLADHAPVTLVPDIHHLGTALDLAIERHRQRAGRRGRRPDLNFCGVENVNRRILDDLLPRQA